MTTALLDIAKDEFAVEYLYDSRVTRARLINLAAWFANLGLMWLWFYLWRQWVIDYAAFFMLEALSASVIFLTAAINWHLDRKQQQKGRGFDVLPPQK